MATITKRATKGSPLTNDEVDANFENLNTDKYESGDNIDVGTVTADGLTVDGTTNLNGFVDILSSTNISGTDVYGEVLRLDNHGARGVGSGIGISFFQNADERSRISAEYDVSGQGLHFYTRKDGDTLKERLTVNGIGDISFYEDTGVTPKFHWDAADERLGIGTSLPTTTLHVVDAGTGGDGTIHIGGTISAATGQLFYEVSGTTYFRLKNTYRSTSANAYMEYDAGYHKFLTGTGGTEAMRLDSSGNLLVGSTTLDQANNSNTANCGINLFEAGTIGGSTNGAAVAYFNRLSSDGDIISFRKDGGNVGAIGTSGGHVTIGNADSGDGGAGVRFVKSAGNDRIEPWDMYSNTARDGQIDLGNNDPNRFRDLYLSGGVYLGGTGSANKLDDYEEGTWTPEIADALTGGNTAAGGTFEGIYTKIGNIVIAQANCTSIDTTGMTSGNLIYVRNFPFTSASTNNAGSATISTSRSISYDANTVQRTVRLLNSRTHAFLEDLLSTGGVDNPIISDITSGSGRFDIQMIYRAS